jgi:hypothetical protein
VAGNPYIGFNGRPELATVQVARHSPPRAAKREPQRTNLVCRVAGTEAGGHTLTAVLYHTASPTSKLNGPASGS